MGGWTAGMVVCWVLTVTCWVAIILLRRDSRRLRAQTAVMRRERRRVEHYRRARQAAPYN